MNKIEALEKIKEKYFSCCLSYKINDYTDFNQKSKLLIATHSIKVIDSIKSLIILAENKCSIFDINTLIRTIVESCIHIYMLSRKEEHILKTISCEYFQRDKLVAGLNRVELSKLNNENIEEDKRDYARRKIEEYQKTKDIIDRQLVDTNEKLKKIPGYEKAKIKYTLINFNNLIDIIFNDSVFNDNNIRERLLEVVANFYTLGCAYSHSNNIALNDLIDEAIGGINITEKSYNVDYILSKAFICLLLIAEEVNKIFKTDISDFSLIIETGNLDKVIEDEFTN